jgi:hypothetical protein
MARRKSTDPVRAQANQSQLQAIIAKNGYTQLQVSQILEVRTGRPCRLRTVQAWLANPDLPSARACPDWAINTLNLRDDEKKRPGETGALG